MLCGEKMINEDELIRNLKHYYDLSLTVLKEFGGPSVYFHIQSIKEQESNFLHDRHIEMIYATLASWGIHRMGDPEKTKAKMVEFVEFNSSIANQREKLKELIHLRMDLCSNEQYARYIDRVKDIYYGLKVSISNATIVAHSKALAHILPNLIPPIDRQHTIRFFTQDNKNFFTKGKYRQVNLPKDKDTQFCDFKKYACQIKSLFDRCDRQLFKIDKVSLNTSYPKIMDNLILQRYEDRFFDCSQQIWPFYDVGCSDSSQAGSTRLRTTRRAARTGSVAGSRLSHV